MVPPRAILRDGRRLKCLGLGVLLLFGIIIMAPSLRQSHDLVTSGRVAQAIIVSNIPKAQENGKALNQYVYTFRDSRGRQRRGTARSAVHLYAVGQGVRVRYFEAAPDVSAIEAIEIYDLQKIDRLLWFVAAGALLLFGMALFFPLRPERVPVQRTFVAGRR